MSGFLGDLRAAFRRLLAAPLFTLFAVLSLAVGVGVTTAAYSIVESLFLRAIHIADPARVAFIATPYSGRMRAGSVSEPDFRDLRTALHSFSSISASAQFSPTLTTRTTAAIARAESVDGAYFSTLGVTAELGRTIQPSDDTDHASVVVLSDRIWQARFAGDPHIVGQVIRVGGRPFEVIGVAAREFAGPRIDFVGTDIWIPRSAEPSAAPTGQPAPATARDQRRLTVFGRLAPSSTIATATRELELVARALDAAFPPPGFGKRGVFSERQWSATSAAELGDEEYAMRRFGLTLLGLVALVLIVACTNLANLVLARGTTRQQEITIRFALGASRWRLIRGQCAESLLLSAMGAAGAYVMFRALQLVMHTEFTMGISRDGALAIAIDPQLNMKALAVAIVSLLLSLLVVGLEPALQLTRNPDIRGELAIGGNPRSRRQRMLLRWQVLTATGFFIVSTMFVKYMLVEMRHDSGVDLERMGVAIVSFSAQDWNEARARRALERAVELAGKKPGVEAVAVSTSLPFGAPYEGRSVLSAPGQVPTGFNGQRAVLMGATPSLFRVLGVQITRGRGFDDRDTAAGPRVAVVSEFTARQLFGSVDSAVGHEVVIDETVPRSRSLAMIVGVASDTDVGNILANPRACAYVPYAQRFASYAAITARSTGAPADAIGALREAIRAADPDIVVNAIGSGRSVLAGRFEFLRGAGLTTVGLGSLTLLLAMVGLFGIQSHLVSRRTREIGVRMSFGATAAQIRWMVLSDGARPVVDGMMLGLVAGLIGRLFVRNYLELQVDVIDPWAFVVIPIPLILASYCACYLPARRAASVDPNVALRHL
ncbi:MAG: ABC transporter permease [Vicinamibacterales bacterium]